MVLSLLSGFHMSAMADENMPKKVMMLRNDHSLLRSVFTPCLQIILPKNGTYMHPKIYLSFL